MSILGRCVIEISHETRDILREKGYTPRGISYDSIINTMISENNKLKDKNKKVENQNDKLQDAFVKLANKFGD